MRSCVCPRGSARTVLLVRHLRARQVQDWDSSMSGVDAHAAAEVFGRSAHRRLGSAGSDFHVPTPCLVQALRSADLSILLAEPSMQISSVLPANCTASAAAPTRSGSWCARRYLRATTASPLPRRSGGWNDHVLLQTEVANESQRAGSGSFANDPQRASEAGREGRQSSGGAAGGGNR
jgi:stress-induced acidophilic repeat protein